MVLKVGVATPLGGHNLLPEGSRRLRDSHFGPPLATAVIPQDHHCVTLAAAALRLHGTIVREPKSQPLAVALGGRSCVGESTNCKIQAASTTKEPRQSFRRGADDGLLVPPLQMDSLPSSSETKQVAPGPPASLPAALPGILVVGTT